MVSEQRIRTGNYREEAPLGKQSSIFQHAPVVISFSLAALYVLGLIFYQAFLRELGIEESQFPLSPDKVFFTGFASVIDMGARSIGLLLSAALGVVIVALITSSLGQAISRYDFAKVISQVLREPIDHQGEHNFLSFSFKAMSYVLLGAVLFLGMLVVIKLSDGAGSSYASKFRERASSDLLWKKEVTMRGSGEVLQGYSIVCNESQCAYLINSQTLILANSDVALIRSIKKP